VLAQEGSPPASSEAPASSGAPAEPDKSAPAEDREGRYARLMTVLELAAFRLEFDVEAIERRIARLKERLTRLLADMDKAEAQLTRLQQEQRQALRDADLLPAAERAGRVEQIQRESGGEIELVNRRRAMLLASRDRCIVRIDSLEQELREVRAKMPRRAQELFDRLRAGGR
jgi:prefoldin subunit 5